MGRRRRLLRGRESELNRFAPIARGALIAVAVWAALSALGVLLPRAPIEQALVEAYHTGALIHHKESSVGDVRRGASQFNDCIILGAGYFRAGSVAQDLASPARPVLENGSVKGACGSLHRALAGLTTTFDFERYHRYLFGQRGIVAAYFQFGSLDSLRRGLLLVTHATAIGLLVWGASRQWRTRRDPTGHRRATHLGSLALMLSGALLFFFFGLRDFGQSVAHAPADIVSMLLLAFVLSRDMLSPEQRAGTLQVLALFGGLTAIFELLIGSLPIGVVAILTGYGLHAATSQIPARESWREAAWGLTAFLGAFLLMFAIKLVAATAVFGAGVFEDFYANLMIRAGAVGATAELSRWTLTLAAFEGLRGSVTTLFWDQSWLAYLAVATAALAIVLALRRTRVASAVLFALAIAVVPVWYAVLPEHTLRHGWFMARILIWPMLVAGVFFIATHAHRTPRGSPRAIAASNRPYDVMDVSP